MFCCIRTELKEVDLDKIKAFNDMTKDLNVEIEC